MQALRREVEQLRAEKAVAIQGRDNQVLNMHITAVKGCFTVILYYPSDTQPKSTSSQIQRGESQFFPWNFCSCNCCLLIQECPEEWEKITEGKDVLQVHII